MIESWFTILWFFGYVSIMFILDWLKDSDSKDAKKGLVMLGFFSILLWPLIALILLIGLLIMLFESWFDGDC